MSTKRITQRLRKSLFVGFAYGSGFLLGYFVSEILMSSVSKFDFEFLENDIQRFASGILIILTIAATAGCIAGYLGGLALPFVGKKEPRWKYSLKSALSIGVPYAFILYLMAFIVYVLSVGDTVGVDTQKYANAFLILGGVFGIISGSILGIWTVGRRFLLVSLAGLVGFALGGYVLGISIAAQISSLPVGALAKDGSPLYPALGISVFGVVGGIALGYAYNLLHDNASLKKRKHLSRKVRIAFAVLGVVIAGFLLINFWSMFLDLRYVLMPRKANLSAVINSDAVGTHWLNGHPEYEGILIGNPVITSLNDNEVVIVWANQEALFQNLSLMHGSFSEDTHEIEWSRQIEVTPLLTSKPRHPQVLVDSDGGIHVLWYEEFSNRRYEVRYTTCSSDSCGFASVLSNQPGSLCGQYGKATNINLNEPALSVDNDGNILAVWSGAEGSLEYSVWNVNAGLGGISSGCIATSENKMSTNPRATALPDGGFQLIFQSTNGEHSNISTQLYKEGQWISAANPIGSGLEPNITTGEDTMYSVWCHTSDGVIFWDGERTNITTGQTCIGRPEIGIDDNGQIHIVFASDSIRTVTDTLRTEYVIYETILQNDAWTSPMITSLPGKDTQPSLAVNKDGTLFLVRAEMDGDKSVMAVGAQTQYSCDEAETSLIVKNILDATYQEKYRSAEDTVAFCNNSYNRLVYTPNPDPEFSKYPPTPSGGFDQFAELISQAEYEVLFSTMSWDNDKDGGRGPGTPLANAVVKLYERLKAYPEEFPRGLNIKILTGNTPPFKTLEMNSQIWPVIEDLRKAGLETMSDPDIGWNLEVANYEGTMPHSHVKLAVVDGKSVITVGFNVQFGPLPEEHPSEDAEGVVDLGIWMTGPVAQDARRVFDELWEGAVRRHCTDLYPSHKVWQITCRDTPAEVAHVPEVMRYYPVESDSIAISMFRTEKHDQADQQMYAAIDSAQESIDIMQVSFAHPFICNLNHFFTICSYNEALPYVDKVLGAVEKNGAETRILVGSVAPQGLENVVTVKVLNKEIGERGLSDQVEVRFFYGVIHTKSLLVDNEFLVVGSQNYHYSAFGKEGGLAEHSIGTDNPEAIVDFQKFFQYYWDQGTVSTNGQ